MRAHERINDDDINVVCLDELRDDINGWRQHCLVAGLFCQHELRITSAIYKQIARVVLGFDLVMNADCGESSLQFLERVFQVPDPYPSLFGVDAEQRSTACHGHRFCKRQRGLAGPAGSYRDA